MQFHSRDLWFLLKYENINLECGKSSVTRHNVLGAEEAFHINKYQGQGGKFGKKVGLTM